MQFPNQRPTCMGIRSRRNSHVAVPLVAPIVRIYQIRLDFTRVCSGDRRRSSKRNRRQSERKERLRQENQYKSFRMSKLSCRELPARQESRYTIRKRDFHLFDSKPMGYVNIIGAFRTISINLFKFR